MISTLLLAALFSQAVDGDTPTASTPSNQDIPDSVMEVWRVQWTLESEEFVAKLMKSIRDGTYTSYEEETRRAAFENLEREMRHYVSWDRIGQSITKKYLLQYCGRDLLKRIGPYLSGSQQIDSIPDDLRGPYQECSIEVLLYVETGPASAAAEFGALRMPDILIRHGIDPNRE